MMHGSMNVNILGRIIFGLILNDYRDRVVFISRPNSVFFSV